MEIHVYMNRTLFLIDRHGVRHPFCQWYWVDKANFKKILHLIFDFFCFPWVDRSQFLLNTLSVFIDSNLMFDNLRIYARNFLVRLGKNITKLFEKHHILMNFILRTSCSNKDVFNNIIGSRNVNRDGFQYILHISLSIDIILC
jgi:hypothetical protein